MITMDVMDAMDADKLANDNNVAHLLPEPGVFYRGELFDY